MSEIVEVTQEDRDAARAFLGDAVFRVSSTGRALSEAFARHRLAAEARSHDGEWEAMREALKPFSEALGDIAGPDKDRWPDDDTIDFDGFPEFITVGDLRRAREIYTRVSAVPLFDEGRL